MDPAAAASNSAHISVFGAEMISSLPTQDMTLVPAEGGASEELEMLRCVRGPSEDAAPGTRRRRAGDRPSFRHGGAAAESQ